MVHLLLAVLLTAPAGPVEHRVQLRGAVAGKETIETGAGKDQVTHVDYSFADRGRGDHITASWKLDAQGVLVEYDGGGKDYWGLPFTERFRLEAGKATWKSTSESGEKALTGSAFFLPAHAPPEVLGVLARALLKAPGHRLPLLPEGVASLESGPTVVVPGAHGKTRLTLYRITGLDFTPTPVWLDPSGATAGLLSDWLATYAPEYAASFDELLKTQDLASRAWHAKLARDFTHQPKGALLVRHARLFDPRDLSVAEGQSVLIEGERITRVGPDAQVEAPAGAEVLDAAGRFVMPGLWDCHQHFGETDGIFDLIAGVTSARDLANDNLAMLERVKRFDAGAELGPRVLLAGIIEGVGPLAGPTDVKVETPEKALAAVDWYADHGYRQVKIYSSLDPALVPVIARRAHARGMRVSGHVPANTYARQFIEDGADEIQHFNFMVLNFLWPEVKETRGPDRYTLVAENARSVGPKEPRVAEFIAFLRQHHTVLDPTMGILEGLYAGDPAKVTPGLAPLAPRFPAQVRRRLTSAALPVPVGREEAYAAAFPALLTLLKGMYDGGVTLVPGTDAFAGYSLHRELELYARAGIPAAEVLRIATLTPAKVMGVDKERGAIAPGMLADLLLIDGDPSRHISDIRRVHRTIKGGKVYDPAALEAALGMLPPPESLPSPVKTFSSGQVLPAGLPFPEGARVGQFVFLSGTLGNVPGTLKLVEGGLRAEALQTLRNIQTALRAQGLDLQHLARCTIMLADIKDWPQFNEVYRDFFGKVPPPARSAMGVSGLALGARVEIECTAAAPQ